MLYLLGKIIKLTIMMTIQAFVTDMKYHMFYDIKKYMVHVMIHKAYQMHIKTLW